MLVSARRPTVMRTIPVWLLVMTTVGLTACSKPLPFDNEEGALETETGDPGDDLGDPDEGETSDPGTVFVIMDGPIIADCDPWMQDCLEGEKCVPYSSNGTNWNANKCVTVNGDGQPGDNCSYDGIAAATDSCAADSHCWDVMEIDGQPQGVCTSFCEGSVDNPTCGPETACLIANDGSINLCIATCNPISQDCGSGLGCFWGGDDFQCIFTAGEIMAGEPCGFLNDCAPGNMCAVADVLPACNGTACCTPFCDLTDPICGDPATECAAFFEEGMAPPDYESIGVCIIPGA
jgi:hypothetical protein